MLDETMHLIQIKSKVYYPLTARFCERGGRLSIQQGVQQGVQQATRKHELGFYASRFVQSAIRDNPLSLNRDTVRVWHTLFQDCLQDSATSNVDLIPSQPLARPGPVATSPQLCSPPATVPPTWS